MSVGEKMRYVFLYILSFCMVFVFFLSCTGQTQPYYLASPPSQGQKGGGRPDSEDVQIFLLDGKESFFNQHKWYYYTLMGHKIWSLFDIYVIRTPEGRLYRMQVMSYYGSNNSELDEGIYRLRIQPQGGEIKEISVEAKACGNRYTNANLENCEKSKKNVFNYLSLTDYSMRKMSNEEAKADLDWHLGFKRTDIIINEGSRLAEATMVGVLYSAPEKEKMNILKLQNKRDNEFGIDSFKDHPLPPQIFLKSPTYISQVMYDECLDTSSNKFLPDSSRPWWQVRDALSEEVYNLTWRQEDPSAKGEMNFSFQIYDSGDFSGKTFSLILKPKKNKKTQVCLDLNSRRAVDCLKDFESLEVKLIYKPAGFSKNPLDCLSLSTSRGARGPLKKEDLGD